MTNLSLTAAHLALAIVLFFITNWIGKHSIQLGYMQLSLFVRADEAPAFNFVLRVLTPVVYMLILSAAAYALRLDFLTKDVYLVVVYYFLFRILFNIVLGRARLLNWPMQGLQVVISAGISWIAYRSLVTNRSYLLPDINSLAGDLWLVIIGFVYLLFNRVRLPRAGTERRKKGYLENRYKLYQRKYGHIIRSIARSIEVQALIYAVMIYEAFNRPKLYRLAEYCVFMLGAARTLGVMQVQTKSYISEERSVELGSAIIAREYAAAVAGIEERIRHHIQELRLLPELAKSLAEHEVIGKTLEKYNKSARYASEVEALYHSIMREFYGDVGRGSEREVQA